MFLLQMAGYPGSGKSTVSKMIGKNLNAVVLDRDIIKSSMIESEVPDDIVAKASYNVVFDLARAYLGMGMSVIIDTPCFYKEGLENGQKIAKDLGAEYKYIECKVADYKIIEDRIKNRVNLVSHITKPTQESHSRCLDMSVKPTDGNYLVLDTSSEERYDMRVIQEYLSK